MDKKNSHIFYAGVLVLLAFTFVIVKYERLRTQKQILLELRPRDPRSLMQGDYMELRYRIAWRSSETPNSGYLICRDSAGIAVRVRAGKEKSHLQQGEFFLKFSTVDDEMYIGPDEFFFQEGHGREYARAGYAKVALSEDGAFMLLALYDRDKKLIK